MELASQHYCVGSVPSCFTVYIKYGSVTPSICQSLLLHSLLIPFLPAMYHAGVILGYKCSMKTLTETNYLQA